MNSRKLHQSAPFAEPFRLLFVLAVSLPFAALLTALLIRILPVQDPIDVVGVPLIQGYSEQREQLLYYLFFAALCLVAMIVGRFHLSIPRIGTDPAVWAAGLLLLIAGGTRGFYYSLLLFPTCLLVSFGLGSYLQDMHRPPTWRILASIAASLVFAFFSSTTLKVVVKTVFSPLLLAVLALIGVILWYGFRHRFAGFVNAVRFLGSKASTLSDKYPLRAGFLLLVACYIANPGLEWRIIPLSMFGMLLGACVSSDGRFLSPLRTPYIVPIVALAWIYLLTYRPMEPHQVTSFWLSGVMVTLLAWPALGKKILNVKAGLAKYEGHWHEGRLWLLALSVPFAIVNFWVGCTLSLVLAAVCVSQHRPARFRVGLLFSLLLMVIFLPTQLDAPQEVDPLHDGQILSALQEWDRGRLLYAEVFPLRTYHFSLAVLGRGIFPPTLEGFYVTQRLVMGLHVGGSFLLALRMDPLDPLGDGHCRALSSPGREPRDDDRLGVCAKRCIYGLPLSPSKRCAAASSSSGECSFAVVLLSAACGYDAFISTVAAFTLASYFRAQDGNRRLPQQIAVQILHALAVASLLCLIPTACLMVWQGLPSATAYWKLLFDNLRHVNAFYGLPLSPSHGVLRRAILGAGLLATWIAGSICFWRTMGGTKRQSAVFLSVFAFFIFQRVLGRSADSNFVCMSFLSINLFAIGAFEVVSHLRLRGIRNIGTDRTLIGLSATVLFLWMLPIDRLSTPWSLYQQIDRIHNEWDRPRVWACVGWPRRNSSPTMREPPIFLMTIFTTR